MRFAFIPPLEIMIPCCKGAPRMKDRGVCEMGVGPVDLETPIDIVLAEILINIKLYSSRRGKLDARGVGKTHTVAG
jgi:hypothetical protein